MLLERMKGADLARMMRVNNVRVVDAALEPVAPVRPRVMVNTLVGMLVGLLGGLALALVRQQLDSSIKTPGDVEHLLGSTFLGLLPAIDDNEGSNNKGRRRKNKQGGVGHHTEPRRARETAGRHGGGGPQHSYESLVHEPGPSLQEDPRLQRRAGRGKDDGGVQHRYRHGPRGTARVHRRLRPPPPPPSSDFSTVRGMRA